MFTSRFTFRRDAVRRSALVSSFVILVSSFFLPAAETAAPREFPAPGSARRVSGELVGADFIHRKGQFRAMKTGELMDFALPPFGAIFYANAEADLRNAPLGTVFEFHLHPDADGHFTRLAAMRDQFTADAREGISYRLVEVKSGEGKLLVSKRSGANRAGDLGKQELVVTSVTRVWRGDQRAQIEALKVGDELLFNLASTTANQPAHCADIWIGADTHALATEQQRKKFAEFTKKRGLPGWVDRTVGNTLTVSLFSGDAQHFQRTWLADFAVGKNVSVCVANDELRTWNPPVDKARADVIAAHKIPTDTYGSSGLRIELTVKYMLEGFRRGRVVRVFGPGWPIKDSYYGESLMGYGYGRLQTAELMECTPKEYPAQFPYRTDYGNARLPWHQLKPGEVPPPFAEHLVFGELANVDAEKRTGQFRRDRTGELVSFTVLTNGAVKFLNADAKLSDLPSGTRCRFHLFQDDAGAFTRASLVSDEFSFLAANAITHRVEELRLDEGRLIVARQIPDTKNYNGDLERIPDIGRTELRVTAETRVWKGEQQLKLTDLSIGDSLLVNLTGELPGHPARCTDIWIGPETHKLVTEQQRKKTTAPVKKRG